MRFFIKCGALLAFLFFASPAQAGLIITPISSLPGNTPGDPFDISTGVIITAHTPTIPGSDIRDILGGAYSTLESPGHTLFADRSAFQVDTLSFTTPAPVTIAGFNLYLPEDGGSTLGSRSVTSFELDASGTPVAIAPIISPGSSYAATYGSAWIKVSYTFASPLTANSFEAIFTANNHQFPGPRVWELDGVPVPEPAAFTLFGIGFVAMLSYGWKRNKSLAKIFRLKHGTCRPAQTQ